MHKYALDPTQFQEIHSGDTFFSIAKKHGISLQELEDANPCIEDPTNILPNEKITIPDQQYCF
ncbi:19102_t:CDS:2 [Gigaspora margarita]|uniref:19102_t:CDS:1 n=1 Tax=Gigaspora margarita TaxID=4874 RepID=A0ABN7V0H8_GIGMA|nr:19102_t:CDS:2 [Gigaspora margarita]